MTKLPQVPTIAAALTELKKEENDNAYLLELLQIDGYVDMAKYKEVTDAI